MKFLVITYLLVLQLFLPINNSDIIVNKIDSVSLDNLIKERNGKILLINIWATWCIPCREEFPDLVKLNSAYKNKIDVVAVSVDYEDEIESKIMPFLKKNNVNFPVYVSGFNNDDSLINYFKSEWSGAIPATFIFDMDGKEIKMLEGKHSFESFSSIIDEIIN